MLRRFHIARLAFHHSPFREQRLLRVAPAQPKRPDEDETRMDPAESGGYAGKVELSERQKFHDAIFEAVLPDDQRTVLNEYLPSIQKELGTFNAEQLSDDELEEVMQLTRISLVDQMNREESDRRMLATSLKSLDPSTMTSDEVSEFFRMNSATIRRYFKIPDTPNASTLDRLQALLHTDMERLRKADRQRVTGIRWENLHAEDFEKIYRKKRGVKSGESVRVPSAFAYKGTMYFNVDDETFTDPENGKLMADRAVAHEATHLAVGLEKDKRFDLGSWTRQLKSHPRWKELSAAVEEVFRSDPDYMEPGTKNEVITSEALSIYVANARHPLNEGDQKAQQAVYEIMEDIFRDPPTGMITMMKKHLDETLYRFLEVDTRNDDDPNAGKTVGQMLVDASNDSRNQRNLAEMLSGNTVKNADGVLTNTDDATNLAKQELSENDDKDAVTPSKVSGAANKAYAMIAPLVNSYPGMKSAIQKEDIADGERRELLASVDQNLEFLSQTANDLNLIRKYADILGRWEAPESAGGLSAAEKAEFADRIGFASNPYRSMTVSMEEADAQTKEDRKTLLSAMQDSVKNSETVLSAMQKAVDAADGRDEGHQTDLWQWLKKNVFSSQGNIAWITPLNIMSIIKIYKDAIVQNYQSNQKVKENRFAKNWNIYKPIDHTLKKLARSANNTESSEFKEYLEKEGYTFDEVFGKDGRGKVDGLLHDNRHNFNRAKAVLEYAADHAWLYFLDPLHGHDVYGIDFEGIEGKQSFEELVQQHESGKSKQIDHGYERIDKYPDVPPMMDTMVHELRHKNIFAVQGIMKRLQDKAKFSHSNTWMLTTLLMLIRDECDNDPTLKYCLDKGMIDNISNHTIQQSAWSITWLKMRRSEIIKWRDGKEDFGNNILTQTMEKIEKKLEQAGAHFPPDTPEGRLAKYEAIAMVLSGKTLHEGSTDFRWPAIRKYGWKKGAVISLFQDDFSDYREKFNEETEQASSDPGKSDPDYFNVRMGGSDIVLLNIAQMVKILKFTSTAVFQEDEKARGFFAQVFARTRELKESDPEAYENFRKSMNEKLSMWWNQETDTSRRKTWEYKTDQLGNNISEQLIELDLVSDTAKKSMNAMRLLAKGDTLKQKGSASVRFAENDAGKKEATEYLK